MPFNIQGPELIVLLVIALLVLGPGKLPEVGAALGKSIREFRKAASDVKDAASIEPAHPAAPVEPAQVAAPVVAAPVTTPIAPVGAPVTTPSPAQQEPVAVAPAASDSDKPAS